MLSTSQTQRTLIPINIETLAGTSFELLVSPYEQIQSIKHKIERREGIPTSHQHLIYKSNELDDESCLNDYNIESGTTLKLVLAMRGGPVNTKRVPIEENFLRDMSEYIESNPDDYDISNDLSSNKNVTFLVLRDGDQFNFFQVIDRGDGTLSPLSGSISAASMYNTHDRITVETDEKRQADDRKTKQKMETIRSKLKTHPRKDILFPPRPSSSSKQMKSNLLPSHRRTNPIETNSNVDNLSSISSLEQQQQQRPLSYSFSSNLFNTYNFLSTTKPKTDLLHEEDTEDDDEDDDDDDDSHDDDNDTEQKPIYTSRLYSPSIFYQKKTQPTKKLFSQETSTTRDEKTTTNNNIVSVDYIPRISPTVPLVSTSSRILSATKCDERRNSDEKTDIQSRNETSLSKPLWTDDDEQINLSDGRTSTSQSLIYKNSTPIPTLPKLIKKSSTHSRSIHHEQTKPLTPLSLSKYRRTSTLNESINNNNTTTDTFNEHLMLNKRIEILKTPGKQQSPISTPNNNFPPPAPLKRQENKSILPATPASSSSILPIDSTKVTIETIGPKTVSALLRQNATIEPVDTSRGVGKHLVSLLTTASKETNYKQSSRDAIIEERYKFDSKWSNTNPSIVSSSLQSNTATIYNSNKLPPVIVNRKSTSKCFLCKKKTGLATTYQCRCGSSFCSEHRYPEAHACAFDYKAEGKRLIERNNPLITAPKLPKI